MSFFERWLTLWVFLCIVAGTAVGVAAPELAQAFARLPSRRSTSRSAC
jgi:ACR3 family arsenite transporter